MIYETNDHLQLDFGSILSKAAVRSSGSLLKKVPLPMVKVAGPVATFGKNVQAEFKSAVSKEKEKQAAKTAAAAQAETAANQETDGILARASAAAGGNTTLLLAGAGLLAALLIIRSRRG